MSFGQEALWFLTKLAPESRAYHLCGAARLLERCDGATAERVERAFAALSERHPALRTTFGESSEGRPEQRIGGGPGVAFAREVVADAEELNALLSRSLDAPFDLESGPLVRAGLITAGDDTVLWLAAHHLVADFWSLAVMLRDLGVAFSNRGEIEPESEPQLSYAEWARWQRERTAGAEGERERAAWREILAGELPRLELPTDRPRRAKVTWDGGAVDVRISAEAARALGRVARGAKSNLFSALLTAFQAFLSRISGQDDLIVGTPTTGRFGARVGDQVGYFVNPVPVRADLSGDPTFIALLARQRPAIQSALALQAYPFSRLAEEIQPERDPGRSPIFDAMLAYEKARGGEGFWGFALGLAGSRVDLGGLALESLRVEPAGSPFDLSLAVSEVAGGLAGSLRFSSELFDRATIERWAGWLVRWIEGAAAEPDRRLSELPLLSLSEQKELRLEAGPPGVEIEGPGLVHDFLARHARERPDELCLESEHEPGRRYTWSEAAAHTDRLARRLAGLGGGPEKVVGVSLERSVDRVLSMYAIWQAGACYLPVDPEMPAERRALLLRDAGAVVVMARAMPSEDWGWIGRAAPLLLSKESGLPVDGGPEEEPRAALPENLAYVIYTSGSTGVPKGVAISHRHAAGHFAAAASFYRMDSTDRVVQFASASFDVSMEQVGVALASGGTLVVRGPELPAPLELSAWMERLRITNANLPTAVWSEWSWAEDPLPKNLRVLVTGGEAMTPAAAERFRLRMGRMERPPIVYNGYGPTETVVTATCFDLGDGDLPVSGAVPIGRLLPGRTAFVGDRTGAPQPVGLPGELALGGLLARGYLARPDLTAERFRPDPFAEKAGSRVYWTGDRVRQRGDISLDYLGRIDGQIKIRGVRIEPGEIETALSSHPGVKDSVVLAREAPNVSGIGKRLIAWYRPSESKMATAADLRQFLAGRLPAALVPAAFVEIAEWPLTPTGKVDRRALPEPNFDGAIAERIAPRTAAEQIVAGLFADLLGISEPSVEADFFALGGHSLLATQLASRIRRTFAVELPLGELFADSTVSGIAARIDARVGVPQAPPLHRIAHTPEVELSFGEERLWFLNRLEPGMATYNVGFRLALDGPLKPAALAAALRDVVIRHSPLRTIYTEREGRPYATLRPAWAEWRMPVVDLSGGAATRFKAAEAARIAKGEGRRPFDLGRGPLLRATLLLRGAERHDALFVFHHIATDGWSLGVFSRDLAELYGAAIAGRSAHLPALAVEYADWAAWQRGWLSGETYKRELSWWRERLAGAPEILDLPADRPRASEARRAGGWVRRLFSSDLSVAVAKRSREAGATPFMVLLAAWAGLLARLGAGSDLVVGTVVANRNRPEIEDLIGFFVNSLAVRLSVESSESWNTLLERTRAAALGAYAHQDFPFDRLVAELGGARAGKVPPLFQVALVLQNLPETVLLPGISTEIMPLDGGVAKLDLSLVLSPIREGGAELLVAELELNLDLFDPATGARLLGSFERMVAELVAHPERALAEAELLGQAERHQLLVEWNEGGGELPPVLANDFVTRWLQERPEGLALESEHEPGRRYTWREVAAHSDRLARRLAGLGAGPERVVGVSLERSVDRVLAMVAIWKAGACYLPVDPELPVERQAFLLADARALVLIAREIPSGLSGLSERVAPLLLSKESGLPVVPGPEENPRRALPENLAYVIYTSGSTGMPKGVGISHRASAGHFSAAASFYRMDASDRVVQFASASFDVSMEQVGVALASGGTLVVRGPELPPPLELSAWMSRWGITNANLPTAVWSEWSWSEAPMPSELRVLVTGGEAMSPAAAERFRLRLAEMDDPPVVYNGYGPTETVVTATCYDLRHGKLSESGAVSIGRLLPRRTGFVVDEAGEIQPLGGVGELLLGGLLARGYLDRPDLTAERFCPDPFTDKAGARIYRTGDRVRQRCDGTFDYLGRSDQQIKIRGFRIEPGEIEAALCKHPAIREAIVLARETPKLGKRLIAWVRPLATYDAEALRRHLSARLPAYMVPAAFVEIATWPLTPTGKVDRRALPDPSFESAAERIALRTPTEEIVAGLFAELLGVKDLGAESDFFALGGHSLLATQLASRIRRTFAAEFPLAELFAGSTVAAIAERIDAVAGGAKAPPLVRKTSGEEKEGELSFAEERLWFLDRLEPGTAAYNVGFRLTLDGPFAFDSFNAALSAVVARHARLRTRFGEREGKPFAKIDSPGAFPVSRIDLSGLVEDREAARLAAAEGRRPFDLSHGPLLRVTLLRRSAHRHDALFVFHHIVTDGWSISVFSREMAELYAAALEQRSARLPSLPIEVADWAAWQRGWLSGEVYERQLAWWRERLAGAPEILDLPTDWPRPALAKSPAWLVRRELPSEIFSSVVARSRAAGATPFMVLLAAWAGLLSRLGAGRDLVIGAPIANRNRAETEGLIGFFVNSLTLRIAAEPEASLATLLERSREAALGAYAHQDFPFDRLVGELAGARSGGAPPLFQTSLVFQNLPETARLSGLKTAIEPLGGGVAKLDLMLVVSPVRETEEECLSALLELNLDLFDPATGARLLRGFEAMVEELSVHPERALAQAELLGPAEKHQLLAEWNDADLALAPLRVHDFIARHARERPDELALESEHEIGRRYTWAEVDRHTDRLARRLAALGAGPERVVAVSLPWSVDRPLAMFAIWKAGACYLPVDPELPAERQVLLLEDSRAVVLMAREVPSELTVSRGTVAPLLLSKKNGLPVDSGPEEEPRAVVAENLAYIIYTSGSTGKPKGVAVSHAHAAGHFAAAAWYYRMDSSERVVQFASASFDVSMEQVGVALASGGTLVVRGPEMPPPLELSTWLERQRITHANLPTAVWTEWSRANEPLPRGLRVLVTAGEAMSPAAAERFRKRMTESPAPLRILNGYGPTEAVVIATCHDIAQGRLPESGSVSIGRPLPGRTGSVVDESGEIQSIGGVGELALGGLLARGYLDRPDLTAERFRPNPLTDAFFGARVYRTGDRVRQRGDGSFDFLGRIDQQIKIRGFRIEPGEIEAAIAEFPGIGEAIVLARATPPGDRRLIAWFRPVVLGAVAITASELRRFLTARLPDYMVPAAFVEVAEWPKSPSGKIDRKSLPEPERDAGTGFIAPRTPTEEIVAGLFAELLGASEVGSEADFFALGGHSLLATRLASRLRRTFGVELPLAELFAGSTVASIAERIDALAGGLQAPPLVRKASGKEGEGELSFAEERLWFLDRLEPGKATYNVGFRLALDGPLAFTPFVAALTGVVARHARLRTRFAEREGRPYAVTDPASEIRVPRIDLSAIQVDAEAARVALAEGRRTFDLARGPLLRTTVVERRADRHDALFVFHHIATDGWSLGLFSRELAELYAAAIEHRPATLPDLPIEYADWAAWQRSWMTGEVYDRQLAWWRERLAGAPEILDLPADRPRPLESPRRLATVTRRELPADLSQALAARARASGSTLFMVLFASWAALLSRLGAGEDLVIGTPIANRNRAETEGLIGFFVNSLAIRIATAGSPSLAELLSHAREAALSAYAHQDFPFDRLVAELGGVRGGHAPPIYQVSIGLQNLPAPVMLPGLAGTFEEIGGETAKLDLALTVLPARGPDSGLLALLELNLDLFDPATGARLLAGFERIAAELSVRPEKTLAEVGLLGPTERHQLLTEWNDVGASEEPALLHDFLARNARERPDASALESEDREGRRYSWAELDAVADRLARRLAALGAGPERVVGVSLERGVDRQVAILGVWKAGACYLPVDPELPIERRAFLLADAGAVVLMARDLPSGLFELTRKIAPLLLSKENGLPVDSGPEVDPRAAAPDNLAYLFYTSGSTGVPKGVAVSHAGAGAHFAAAARFYGLGADDRIIQFAEASFDVSMEQLGLALVCGATLVVRGPELPADLPAWLDRLRITDANLPTAVWNEWAFSNAALPSALRVLVVGGEAMTPAAAERFRKKLAESAHPPRLLNAYGPTEAVVTATCCDVAVGWLAESGAVSIGRLMPQRIGWVADGEGEPQALGGIGELVLGRLLARGYLGRPELTAERFRPDPFAEKAGARVYRTGDRVRQRGDGSFDYLGRVDSQVKLRGVRIEPGEIEAALTQHPNVKEAIVLLREAQGAGARLIAWFRPSGPIDETDASELRRFLASRLPAAMVPSAFGEVANWPLSPTGKIDRRALPEPTAGEGNPERLALRTPTEEIVAGLFADLLGVSDLSAEADFFALGGHSLLATQLASRLRKAFQVEIPLGELFAGSTVAGIAERIAALASAGAPFPPPLLPAPPRPAEIPLSFAQERLWFLDRLEPGRATYNTGFRLQLEAAERRFDAAALKAALRALIVRHEPLRTRFVDRGDRPLQEIEPADEAARSFRLPWIDLSGSDFPGEAERIARNEGSRPFDLSRGPMLRVTRVLRGAAGDDLLFSFHHIATDGWSLGVVSRELEELYTAALERRGAALPALPLAYADWSLWQRAWLTGEVYEGELSWWRERLAGAPEALELPFDHPRPARASARGWRGDGELPAELAEGLAARARSAGATLSMALLAAWAGLLSRLGAGNDLVIGLPVANRNRVETEGLIGFFVNNLALRIAMPEASATLGDLMTIARDAALPAYAHQDFPFERLVAEAGAPPAQVSFAFQNLPAPVLLPGIETRFEEMGGGGAKFDLGLIVVPAADRRDPLATRIEISLDRFDPATGARLLRAFGALAGDLAADPEKSWTEVNLLGVLERHQLLIEWNDADLRLPGVLIHDSIARNARERPDAPALESEHEPGRRYTWREVEAHTERLARRLSALGAGPERSVAVSLEWSVDRVLAAFAVWKAGACYVPVDPELPAERRRLLLADARAGVLIARETSWLSGWSGTVVPLLLGKDDGLPVEPGPEKAPSAALTDNLAYVIYTSGSTGLPKGVAVSHRHAVAHLEAAVGFYRWRSDDRVILLGAVSFDLSIEQFGCALRVGATVVVRGPELPAAADLSSWLSRLRITCATLTTALWNAWTFAAEPLPPGLRMTWGGGEAMTAAAAQRFRARVEAGEASPRALNAYGPTETVIVATGHDLLSGRLPDSGAVSIGRLLPRRTSYVMDARGKPLPLGGLGELALGGLLARGYLDRPELTADRFRPDPFGEPGARVYRTGDRVRQRGDGSFDFLGRIDSQVKLRGFRIEAGEIEAVLAEHPNVQQAIVMVRETPEVGKRLFAWVRPLGAFDSPELARFLAGRLPSYMVPSGFIEVGEWPLTPTGKVDRRALPDPTFETDDRAALRTPTEEIVAGLFAELLGLSALGAEADFFALGGHSLLATQLASRLRKTFEVDLPLADLFTGSTVAGIAERIDALAGRSEETSAPLVRAARPAEIPLSFAQERLWFLDRLEPGMATYNVGFRLQLGGPLVPRALAAALAALVARHEPLRTRYVLSGNRPVQLIDQPGAPSLPCVDLEGLGEGKASAEAERLAEVEGRRPFDLARGPVLRSTLIRRAPDLHDALFVFHHIATDGWSIGVFSRELVELYTAATEEKLKWPGSLAPLPIEYADWALWQRGWLAGEVYDRQLAWWRERLAGAPEVLDLPLDRPRPAEPTRRGRTMRRELSVELSAAVASVSRATAATPYMVLLAAWSGLLSRWGSGRDMVIGLPIANRNRAETEGLIGFFVNSLPIRISIEGEPEPTLAELIVRARAAALGAYAHQDFPFDRLVAELGGARGAGIPPIYQVSLALQNLPEPVLLPGLATTAEELGGGLAKLDLGLVVVPLREGGAERLAALLELNLDLFDPATGARLLAGFEAMLGEIAVHPERSLGEAGLIGASERHQLLTEWNDRDLAVPPVLVHDFIARHARERPNDLALESEHEPGRRYTWAEANAHAERLARRLAGLGAGPEKVVGVSLERSVDRVLAMFAIWKAGACYLPVDPELPVERRALLLSDAAAVVLMARELPAELLGLSPAVAPLLLSKEDGLPLDFGPAGIPREVLPENLAYIIYTSGSTGVPKGVAVSHRHAAGHFAAAAGFYRMDSTDRVVQFAAASFDVSMEQVGVALASGGTLVVRGPELPPPLELSSWLTRWRITNANLPTAVWTEWSRSEAPLPKDLRVLVTGGEAMTPAAAKRFRARLAEMDHPPVVYNGYGPTETVVTATCYALRFGRLAESGSVSIGRLMPGRTGLVVDEAGEIQPLGGIGELVLGGLLARGYLDRPDLTAERFRPDPFTDNFGARIYRTGDRVRQRGDGSFDYLGRTDSQIKIRGFRIEPGEIEAALAQHPAVHDAIVLARDLPGAGPRLIAWYRPLAESTSAAELRAFLAARLPEYMVPSAFVEVLEWPIAATGKIDRRVLPEPMRSADAERTLPATPIQQVIADLWREALPELGEDLGVDDSFFELGGHSLLAVGIASKVAASFQVEVPLKRLFEAPTIAGLEAAVLAAETRPGQSEKIARVLMRMKSLSPEAKRERLAVG